LKVFLRARGSRGLFFDGRIHPFRLSFGQCLLVPAAVSATATAPFAVVVPSGLFKRVSSALGSEPWLIETLIGSYLGLFAVFSGPFRFALVVTAGSSLGVLVARPSPEFVLSILSWNSAISFLAKLIFAALDVAFVGFAIRSSARRSERSTRWTKYYAVGIWNMVSRAIQLRT
jgi:hypothetical protein